MVGGEMEEQVHCNTCRYAGKDESFSSSTWDAIECKNEFSDYYGCLLNVYYDGKKSSQILWPGCSAWRSKVKKKPRLSGGSTKNHK